ncbi:MAG: hypothetical protein Q8N96_05305 [Methylovulum sp.]|nr:hypothetical protein [Methylovulum sp.]
MKILFFLVVTANVTFFMWKFKTGAFTPVIATVAQQTAANQEPIVLLGELKPALPNTAPSEPIEAKIEPPPVRCYEAGPFTLPSDYQHWLNVLAGSYTVKPVSKDGQSPRRYIVSSPSSSSEETEASLQMLKKQGITDYFVYRPQDGGQEISLGIFSTEVRAKTMQGQMLAKGIDAKIKVEYKTKTQKYLLIKNADNPQELLATLQKTYPELTLRDGECW